MPWDEAAHPRGEAGSAAGGQFVAAQESTASSTAPAKSSGKGKGGGKGMAYDPRTGKGPGYGTPGGDPQVKKIQQALTKLGLKDAKGNPLKIDGKLGPRTTEAIKAAQRKLGLRPDGVVTPGLMRRLSKPRMAKAQLPGKRKALRKPARGRSTSSPRDSAPAPASRR